MGKCYKCGRMVEDDLIRVGLCPDCYESILHKQKEKTKKIYKLGDCYFNIHNITSMTEPYLQREVVDTLKDKYVETPTKEMKDARICVDGKAYDCENYWDSDYNIGISIETNEQYEQFEKEAFELFNAFINLDGEEND